jgi:FkbM family methyltransferase
MLLLSPWRQPSMLNVVSPRLKRLLGKARRALHAIGYEVRPTENFCWEDQRALVEITGAATIFDVGANRGEIAAKYRSLFPLAQVHCFEPIPEMLPILRARFASDGAVALHELAVSSSDGRARFFVNQVNDTSSLLESEVESLPASYREIQRAQREIEVQTTCLDSFCRRNQIDRIDILKLDIQGGELQALRGAHELLSQHRIGLIYSEVFFLPFYRDQPVFGAIAHYLGEFGYVCHNLYNLGFNGSTGRLMWGDAVFVGPNLRSHSDELLRLNRERIP